eukprot:m.36511 g.36511  ORF g.36511 m.36511 type:complete len:76 (-) comp6678_c1_seq2:71-298(-)
MEESPAALFHAVGSLGVVGMVATDVIDVEGVVDDNVEGVVDAELTDDTSAMASCISFVPFSIASLLTTTGLFDAV